MKFQHFLIAVVVVIFLTLFATGSTVGEYSLPHQIEVVLGIDVDEAMMMLGASRLESRQETLVVAGMVTIHYIDGSRIMCSTETDDGLWMAGANSPSPSTSAACSVPHILDHSVIDVTFAPYTSTQVYRLLCDAVQVLGSDGVLQTPVVVLIPQDPMRYCHVRVDDIS